MSGSLFKEHETLYFSLHINRLNYCLLNVYVLNKILISIGGISIFLLYLCFVN